MLSLDDLRAAFIADREARMLSARLKSDTPTGICRYCGTARNAYMQSRIDGHARCIVSDTFKRTVSDHPAPIYKIARALGVSPLVVRVWYDEVNGGRP